MVGAALALAIALGASGARAASPRLRQEGEGSPLEETRLTMGKWIETQQIISKERGDWQQGKEILLGRIELLEKEVATLAEKLEEAGAGIATADAKRAELLTARSELVAAGEQLTGAATRMEGEVVRLFERLPQPVLEKLEPLRQRMPQGPAATRVSVAERFQNVLGILNELNKANGEITVSHEVLTLGDGRPSEVKALYVGLAQAYYVSARGEGGVGGPSPAGWTWEPSTAIGGDVSIALDILQGKHTPAFVPLPVQIR